MDVKTELVAGPVAGQNAGAGANSWMGYWEVVRSRLGILRGCLAGLSAVALVTFFALRLNLNLSASGSLYFLIDRKSTRLNSSHLVISYAVFCLKKITKSS